MRQAVENYSVLITDDDENCREALREIVELEGYQTLLASSGEEALDIAGQTSVHLALMDMHMPSMTGLETLRLMQQFHHVLPCILVTADASDSLIRQACQANVYSVIHKPVSRGVVLHVLMKALGRYYGEEKDRPDSSPAE